MARLCLLRTDLPVKRTPPTMASFEREMGSPIVEVDENVLEVRVVYATVL
jgi:hypothetical protein